MMSYTWFCLVASQVQHFAYDEETHPETECKNKHILEIQESTWQIAKKKSRKLTSVILVSV